MGTEPKLEELPPVLLRAFGEYDPQSLSGIMPGPLVNNILILTTSDSLDKYGAAILERTRPGKISMIDGHMTQAEAIKNSGKFLNIGLTELRNAGESYATLVASGFEQLEGLPTIQRIFMNAYYLEPHADVYFIISPSVHPEDLSQGDFDIEENKISFFPSESIAMINLATIPQLDEELSVKGALGSMDDGTPLGGIELIITLLKRYKETGFIPKMVGIFADDLERKQGEVVIPCDDPAVGTFVFSESGSTEATPSGTKIKRRAETINKVLDVLGLTEEDYKNLFSNTITYNARHFPLFNLIQDEDP